jgi:hypothetical protein
MDSVDVSVVNVVSIFVVAIAAEMFLKRQKVVIFIELFILSKSTLSHIREEHFS